MKTMQQVQVQDADRMVEINRRFYERLWSRAKLYTAPNFNTWPILSKLCATAPHRMEIGPGLRPRLPLEDTIFIDLSQTTVDRLVEAGGDARIGSIESLDFPDASFDLICAFDIIEHIANDRATFRRLSDLLSDNGVLFFSVPLHPEAWTAFDTLVGHYRRYEPNELKALLTDCDLEIQQSAGYGMKPKSKGLSRLGAWFLERHHKLAMFWFNHIFFPLGLKMQKKLQFSDGLANTDKVEGVLVICKRRIRPGAQDNGTPSANVQTPKG